MRIVQVKSKSIPVHSSIGNAFVNFKEMTTSVVSLESDVARRGKPVRGYGFGSTGRYAVGSILEDRFIPRLLAAQDEEITNEAGGNLDISKIHAILMRNEKPGGHGERAVAVGALDMALWDLIAKIEEKPLYRVLSEKYGTEVDRDVFVYAAGGYYLPGKGTKALRHELQAYLDQGYTKAKIKVGGASLADDLERIEAAIDVLGSGQALAVDANGRFSPEEAIEFGRNIAAYDLYWYEEPVDPLDYQGLREVVAAYSGRLATGENLFSLQDARNLARHGGLTPGRDIIQVDPALSYGTLEYLRIIDMLEQQGYTRQQLIPHGGHLMSLHIAAGLGIGGNEAYPGVFEPFGGFGDDARIEGGRISVSDMAGIGIEGKKDLYRVFCSL
jgi:L-alanine-DL-glutamate epimerase-like enolase superfamily enzyme